MNKLHWKSFIIGNSFGAVVIVILLGLGYGVYERYHNYAPSFYGKYSFGNIHIDEGHQKVFASGDFGQNWKPKTLRLSKNGKPFLFVFISEEGGNIVSFEYGNSTSATWESLPGAEYFQYFSYVGPEILHFDLNLDGMFDVKTITCELGQEQDYIFYENNWVKAENFIMKLDSDEYPKAQAGMTDFIFIPDTGWQIKDGDSPAGTVEFEEK